MMLLFKDALAALGRCKLSLQIVPIHVNFSLGLICGEDIDCYFSLPSFTNSAVDGFALRYKDSKILQFFNCIFFKVVSSCDVGNFFNKFCAIEITTGAKVPYCFDAIIKIEDVVRYVSLRGVVCYIQVRITVSKNENIRLVGEDFVVGSNLCVVGRVISVAYITSFYSFGIFFIRIIKFPRIAFFSTGSELRNCLIDYSLKKNFSSLLNFFISTSFSYQIFNSTTPFILNFFKRLKVTVDYFGCVPDDVNVLNSIVAKILSNTEYNIILTTGGVSKGRCDLITEVFSKNGGNVIFHGVKIKPGKPILFGVFNNSCVFFGLPGNVLATIFCIRFFVFYFLQCSTGIWREEFFSTSTRIGKHFKTDWMYFLKSRLYIKNNFLYTELMFDQESFKLNSLIMSNSIILNYTLSTHCNSDINFVYSLYPVF